MAKILGVDFGTANSSASVNEDNRVRTLEIDEAADNKTVLRSAIYFDVDREVHVGQTAVNRYVQDGATGRFIRSVKTFLPSTSFSGTVINSKRYDLETLIAILLREIRVRAEREVGDAVDTVVLGRPVMFSEDPGIDRMAENRLRAAALKAGFKQISFQLEPIAAGLVFETTLVPGKEEIVLVGDFGGGTSDFTIMRLGNPDKGRSRKSDVLSIGGVYVGGDTVDSLLMWDKVAAYFGRYTKYKGFEGRWHDMPSSIMTQLRQWHLIAQLRERDIRQQIREIRMNSDQPQLIVNLEDLVDSNMGMMLFRAIEGAKCRLSAHQDARIVFEDVLSSRINEPVARGELEKIIQEPVQKIRACVAETLYKADLTASNIDHVFLTGGSSRIPLVRSIFAGMFGEDKLRGQDALTSVAHGLGVSATQLF